MCIRPHIFSRASSLFHSHICQFPFLPLPVIRGVRHGRNVLLFTDTVEELVVSVAHDQVHTDQVVDGAEATGRDVALYIKRN